LLENATARRHLIIIHVTLALYRLRTGPCRQHYYPNVISCQSQTGSFTTSSFAFCRFLLSPLLPAFPFYRTNCTIFIHVWKAQSFSADLDQTTRQHSHASYSFIPLCL